MQSALTISRIIPKHLIQKIQLEKFCVAQIDAANTNKVIQALRPLETLPTDSSFLKRVKKVQMLKIQQVQGNSNKAYNEIILCLSKEKQKHWERIENALRQIFDDKNVLQNVSDIQLPRFAPLTENQYREWAKYWPCNFLEPEFSKETKHSKDQLQLIKEIAHDIKSNSETISLFEQKKHLFQLEGENKQGESAMQGKVCSKQNNPLDHPIMRLAEKWPTTKEFKTAVPEYYYLTGLRLLVGQPHKDLCGMCCMALVHSRIQRVYFLNCEPSLKAQQILHCPKLNHKVEMYMVELP